MYATIPGKIPTNPTTSHKAHFRIVYPLSSTSLIWPSTTTVAAFTLRFPLVSLRCRVGHAVHAPSNSGAARLAQTQRSTPLAHA